ncbi:MAG: MFS transporter [Pseudomonadota bacterium]
MLSVLRNPSYRQLFSAQVLSLLGTGLTTVALALLAFDLAGADAGIVLGTALALKMVAYVCVAPFAGALADLLPLRTMLVALDIARASFVLFLPFVDAVWQIYVLVFVFQSFSAAFTPTFQATIPDILPDEEEYTKALSLSRLAYDLETLLSPLLAGVLLAVMSFHLLFVGTALGFLASAALILATHLPSPEPYSDARFFDRVTRGVRIYWATPRLKGLLALSFAVSAAGSMVLVNTVVYAKAASGGSEEDMVLLLAAFGVGSIVVALTLPRLLHAIPARTAMIGGAALSATVLAVAPFGLSSSQPIASAVPVWLLLGVGASLVMTPSALVLRRSCHAEDRPALFAAQFALSHACWLVAYPAAGVLGARVGIDGTFLILSAATAASMVAALLLWPQHDPEIIEHTHEEMEHAHAHIHDAHHSHSHETPASEPHSHRHRHAAMRHAHVFVIDDHHRHWPRSGA